MQVELQRTRFFKAIFLQVFKDLLVKLHFANFPLAVSGYRNLCSGESEGVDFHEDPDALKITLEVLVDDITAFRHLYLPVSFISQNMEHLNLPERAATERLLLQRLRYEDAEEIFYTYASKPEVTRYLAWPTHKSIADTNEYLRYARAGWAEGTDYTYSVRLKTSGKLIGTIGVLHDHGKIQFGYFLSPTYWGKGYATEACTWLMHMLREIPSVYRIWTFVDAENTASIRVLLKCGLKEEARLIKWMRFVNQHNEPKDCILFRLIP